MKTWRNRYGKCHLVTEFNDGDDMVVYKYWLKNKQRWAYDVTPKWLLEKYDWRYYQEES